LHNLAALGLERLAVILVDLAEVDAETPMGARRHLGQILETVGYLARNHKMLWGGRRGRGNFVACI
jgi:hypothetical protein